MKKQSVETSKVSIPVLVKDGDIGNVDIPISDEIYQLKCIHAPTRVTNIKRKASVRFCLKCGMLLSFRTKNKHITEFDNRKRLISFKFRLAEAIDI